MGFIIEYYLIVINIAFVNLKPVQLGQQGNGIYYGVMPGHYAFVCGGGSAGELCHE